MEKFSHEDYERLKIWKDLVFQEQTWFWQRFAGFTALHAAMITLTVTLQISSFLKFSLTLFGLVLYIFWSRIQEKSLWYVDRYKDPWHKERVRLGFKYKGEDSQCMYKDEMHSNPKHSTTDVSMVLIHCIGFMWLVLSLYFFIQGTN